MSTHKNAVRDYFYYYVGKGFYNAGKGHESLKFYFKA